MGTILWETCVLHGVAAAEGEAVVVELQPMPTVTAVHSSVRLSDLIGVIGTPQFAPCLFDLLQHCFGAEFCAMYAFEGQQPRYVDALGGPSIEAARLQALQYASASYWTRDPSVLALSGQSGSAKDIIAMRMLPEQLADHELRDVIYRPKAIADRLVVWNRNRGVIHGFSALRTRRKGYFTSAEISEFERVAPELAAVLATHERVHRDLAPAARVRLLTSLPLIEARMSDAGAGLSRRELQVCARMLWGLSAPAIAADLGIGEDSVATYRKRAYAKLHIAVERELLIWYLAL